MSNGGFIAVHRSILVWEWYKDVNTKVLFLHLLLKANFKDTRYKGEILERGSLVTDLPSLSEQIGLSVKQIRTSLSKLEGTGEIIQKRGRLGRVVTLCKYDDYQDSLGEEGRLRAGKGQGNEEEKPDEKETEPTTPKAGKKIDAEWEGVFPKGCFRKSSTDQSKIKVLKSNKKMDYIGGWFGRRKETLWNVKEAKALMELNPSKEDVLLMAKYRSKPDEYHRKNIITLLNNWDGELDRARMTDTPSKTKPLFRTV